uniref:Uncharacterized protein n=1 Tax=Oryza barthii TaxID=65489 RepID=A0A0G2KBM3_9ORYZ
MRGLLGGGES